MNHGTEHPARPEVQNLSGLPLLVPVPLVVGLIALGAAAALGFGSHDGKRLAMAYLTGYAAFLTVSVGALFFVIIHHLTRAGWSVTIRRMAEAMAMNVWTMMVLLVPILIAAPSFYHWAHPGEDEVLRSKAGWLNPAFWTVRQVLAWHLPWALLATWFWRYSVRQDRTGEVEITERLQNKAGLMVVIFALTVNFGYMDLLMSLNPHWYSTMFGVYCFAGSFLNFFAVSILMFRFLQGRGVVRQSVNREHYHDMGKFMFAFIFFWSYVAFSQYMLIWYGNMPEETMWFAKRGATTDDVWAPGPWGWVALVLLFGHCFIPFASLLSRQVKRRLSLLTGFAVWMVLMHFVDMFWLIMPEYSPSVDARAYPGIGKSLTLALLCWVGVGGVWLAGVFWFARKASLVPVQDPRLVEAMTYEVY